MNTLCNCCGQDRTVQWNLPEQVITEQEIIEALKAAEWDIHHASFEGLHRHARVYVWACKLALSTLPPQPDQPNQPGQKADL